MVRLDRQKDVHRREAETRRKESLSRSPRLPLRSNPKYEREFEPGLGAETAEFAEVLCFSLCLCVSRVR